MFVFERIAEERIAEAVSRGELDDLPGRGGPLKLDDDSFVPAEMRLAYRVLKNAGFVPEEVILRRRVFDLAQALGESPDEADRVQALKRLDLLRARLAASRGYETGYQMQETYRQKLVACLSKPSAGGRNRAAGSGGRA
ncbi:MAG TPA: DnaJ family domain-containing protein [Gammaproteobacteria bacterium]